jgi:hypothetical protein
MFCYNIYVIVGCRVVLGRINIFEKRVKKVKLLIEIFFFFDTNGVR